MPDLLVQNVRAEVMERLKARAREHRRSLQAEVLAILEEQAGPDEVPEAPADR